MTRSITIPVLGWVCSRCGTVYSTEQACAKCVPPPELTIVGPDGDRYKPHAGRYVFGTRWLLAVTQPTKWYDWTVTHTKSGDAFPGDYESAEEAEAAARKIWECFPRRLLKQSVMTAKDVQDVGWTRRRFMEEIVDAAKVKHEE